MILIIASMLIAGCSHTRTNPVLPENDGSIAGTFLIAPKDRKLLGAWKVTIDPNSPKPAIIPYRTFQAHVNMGDLEEIKTFQIDVNYTPLGDPNHTFRDYEAHFGNALGWVLWKVEISLTLQSD